MTDPRRSPDGRYIAAALRSGDAKIDDFAPQFQCGISGVVRDGQFIYFAGGYYNVGFYLIRVNGGQSEKIVDLKNCAASQELGWIGSH